MTNGTLLKVLLCMPCEVIYQWYRLWHYTMSGGTICLIWCNLALVISTKVHIGKEWRVWYMAFVRMHAPGASSGQWCSKKQHWNVGGHAVLFPMAGWALALFYCANIMVIEINDSYWKTWKTNLTGNLNYWFPCMVKTQKLQLSWKDE